VNLCGAKNDRTSLAVLDFYPDQNKLFLTHIYENIQHEEEVSSDQALYEIIREHSENLEFVCLDAPLNLPKCMRCKLACPGYERCKEKEIQFMWRQWRRHRRKKPRAKLFTPYTQRAAEYLIATELEELTNPQETLGANTAPLAARAHFLSRRLPAKMKVIEVHPRLTVLRVGGALKISKGHLQHYKHLAGGDESRQVILQNLVKRDLIFIYQQDYLKLIENPNSFDALITAYTGYLKHIGQCEKPPKDFPLQDGWIEFPVRDPELF
jgi:predicted nuclease with RNAse H fold